MEKLLVKWAPALKYFIVVRLGNLYMLNHMEEARSAVLNWWVISFKAYDDILPWKLFQHYGPFVGGIHRWVP